MPQLLATLRSGALVDTLLQDVRYGWRVLRRNPLFALTASVSLAIGIGANTTVFTVANALLFRAPAGVADPSRIVDIGRSQNGGGFDNSSYPNYLDVRQRATTLDGVYAYRLGSDPLSLREPGTTAGAERIFGTIVTANYFTVLGVRPAAGRLFGEGDSDAPGASPILVLSHAFWTRRFARDPGVIGRTLQVNGQPCMVIGVAPEGFQGTTILSADVWMPVSVVSLVMPRGTWSLTRREAVWLVIGGRLKTNVSVSRAAAELDTIGHDLEREYPGQNRGKGLRLVPSSPIPGNGAPVAGFLTLLMGIVFLVLVIACTNIAGVLLARATARRREIAVRLAMGAARARLVRQLLTETMVLFLLGGAAGLLLARAMLSLLITLLPALPLPVTVPLRLDSRVIAFAAGVALIAGVLSSLLPALQASKADVVSALKDDSQSSSGRLRVRNAFVVGQVALSIVLVIGAGLFGRALQKASTIDPGFDRHDVELTSLDLSLAGYTGTNGPLFARELVARIRWLQGVESATMARILPLSGGGVGLGGLTVPGVPPPEGRSSFGADWNIVEPGYFTTMRIPIAAGRDFTAADVDGAQPVAILGEATVRTFWPGSQPGDAVGRTILQDAGGPNNPTTLRPLLVIGVARDLKYRSLGDRPRLFVYVPLQQQYQSRMTIVTRTTRGRRMVNDIRAAVASMDPNLPIVSAQTMDEYTALNLVPQRVAASVSGSLGLVGLLLAAIGIYGVMAYAVTRRTREIGIRIALGAQRADVVGMVLRQGMSLALIGASIGLLLAAAASRLLASLLFGIPPLDPVAFGGATALFAATGLAACYVPARRAAGINATEALRYE